MSNLIVQKQMSGLRIKMVTEPEEIEVRLEYNPLLSLNVTLVEKLRRIYLIKLVVNDFFTRVVVPPVDAVVVIIYIIVCIYCCCSLI